MRGLALFIFACFLVALGIFLGLQVPVKKAPSLLPVGRYVQFGMGPLILDTTNGHVCDSYPSGSQLPGGYPPCK